MSIILGLIAEGQQLRGESGSSSTKDKLTEAIMDKILPKLPRYNHKRTLTQRDLEIHYKYSGNYIYFCVAKDNYQKRVCWAFIEELEQEFLRMNNPSNQSRVSTLIKEKIRFYNDSSNDKISNLRNKVDEVKDVMIDNIEKVLDRGEKLEHLTQTTDDIQNQAQLFQRGSKKLKNNMLMRVIALVMILLIIFAAIIVAVILIILIAVCGWSFQNCGGQRA